MKNIFLCAIGLACMAVACNSVEEPTVPVQYGEIFVSLGEPDVEVVTKAAQPDDTDNYVVRVFDLEDQQQGADAVYKDFLPMKLPLGDYYVTAENCTETEAEENNGRMRLAGRSETITLSADNLSRTATVNCEVVNARVAVVFDGTVNGKFSDLKVTVTGENGRTVTFNETATAVETESWFNPQTVNYVISGTFTQLGKAIEVKGSRTLAAKNNIKLLVKLNTSSGQLMPEITISKDIDSPVEVPGEFNPYN